MAGAFPLTELSAGNLGIWGGGTLNVLAGVSYWTDCTFGALFCRDCWINPRIGGWRPGALTVGCAVGDVAVAPSTVRFGGGTV